MTLPEAGQSAQQRCIGGMVHSQEPALPLLRIYERGSGKACSDGQMAGTIDSSQVRSTTEHQAKQEGANEAGKSKNNKRRTRKHIASINYNVLFMNMEQPTTESWHPAEAGQRRPGRLLAKQPQAASQAALPPLGSTAATASKPSQVSQGLLNQAQVRPYTRHLAAACVQQALQVFLPQLHRCPGLIQRQLCGSGSGGYGS